MTRLASAVPARRAATAATVTPTPTSVNPLLHRVAGGDVVAYEALYTAVAPMVHGIALRTVRNRELAEEIVQETMVQVWEQASSFSPLRASGHAWIATIAHRRAVDCVRRENAERRRGRTWGLTSATAPQDPVAEWVAACDEIAPIRGVLDGLTRLQREAIVLAYYTGLTYREVAERLDIPLGTVKTRIRDGLLAMRRLLEARPLLSGQHPTP